MLIVEWIVVYGGANYITGVHGHRVALRMEFDFRLPFMPAASLVYLSLFPMLWLSPFVLQSPARLLSFAYALGIVILTSGIGFLLLPAKSIDSISVGAGASARIFQFADWINLSHNYFPSLHVGMAVVCAVSYSRGASPRAAILYWLWAATIALATLLTRQHYVVDIIAGGILGALVATGLESHAGRLRTVRDASGSNG